MNGYEAARSASAWIDRSDRVRYEFTGEKAAETLNGLFTNNVSRLKACAGLYAAALTNKGKVVADVRVFALPGRFVVDTSGAAGPGFTALIRKYVNPRLANFRDISAEVATIGVFGPTASEAAARLIRGRPEDTVGLTNYACIDGTDGQGFLARIPDLGVPGFDFFPPRDQLEAMRLSLCNGAIPELDPDSAEALRLEAGRPLWGADMDEHTLAQEAALDRPDLNAIAFDKGCYTGQETVARVHFRGHVNRTLRGLRSPTALVRNSDILDATGAKVGDVCSAAISPRFGPIALAYVRHEIDDGGIVSVRSGDREQRATVVALPFA